MKKTKKRLASILLTLVMAMTLFFAAPMTVFAAAPIDPTATDTWDFTTADTNGNGTDGGTGTWSWDQSTLTLTLNNVIVNTSAAIALEVPAGTTIVLNGPNNSIMSTYIGTDATSGIYSEGALTITSSSGGILNVTAGSSNSGYSIGILADTSSGNLTINGNATVGATGGEAGNDFASNGIRGNGSVVIGGTAIVYAIGGDAGGITSGGIYAADDVTISGSANVEGIGGSPTADTSVGITADAGTLTISGNATVQAQGGLVTGQGAESYGIIGNLVISGGSLTAAGFTRALASNYVVPNGYTYWVNTLVTPPGVAGTVSDGNFIIDEFYLFARIVFGTPPAAPTPPPGAGGGANGVPQTDDSYGTLGWMVLLAFVLLGIFGLVAWRRRHRAQE